MTMGPPRTIRQTCKDASASLRSSPPPRHLLFFLFFPSHLCQYHLALAHPVDSFCSTRCIVSSPRPLPSHRQQTPPYQPNPPRDGRLSARYLFGLIVNLLIAICLCLRFTLLVTMSAAQGPDAVPRRHPRRRAALTTANPSLLNSASRETPLHKSLPLRLKKGETFHSTSRPASDAQPSLPLVPRRSSTSPGALEAIAAGQDRMAKILDTLDFDSFPASRQRPTLEDDLPMPRGVLKMYLDSQDKSFDRPPTPKKRVQRVNHHTSDSGLGTSVCSSEATSNRNPMYKDAGTQTCMIMNDSPGLYRRMIQQSKAGPSIDPLLTLRGDYDDVPARKLSLQTGKSYAESVPAFKRHLSELDEGVERSMARRKKDMPPMDINARCKYCDKRFKRPCDLTKHEKTHIRPYKCVEPSCKFHEFGFPTEKENERHYNDKHNPKPPRQLCQFPKCPYWSKRESNVKQHMEKVHKWEYKRTKNNGRRAAPQATPETTSAPTPSSAVTNDFSPPAAVPTPSPSHHSAGGQENTFSFADPPIPNPVGDFELFSNSPLGGSPSGMYANMQPVQQHYTTNYDAGLSHQQAAANHTNPGFQIDYSSLSPQHAQTNATTPGFQLDYTPLTPQQPAANVATPSLQIDYSPLTSNTCMSQSPNESYNGMPEGTMFAYPDTIQSMDQEVMFTNSFNDLIMYNDLPNQNYDLLAASHVDDLGEIPSSIYNTELSKDQWDGAEYFGSAETMFN